MRIFPLILVAFFFAPIVHAACVQNPDDGTYYDSATYARCTPQGTVQTGVNTSETRVTGVNTSGTNVTLINPLNSGTSLSSFLDNILRFVVRIGSVIVILMLVFVGYKFVVAQGSDSKISEARQMLLWTVIGALVLLGAQAIASAIGATVNALGSS